MRTLFAFVAVCLVTLMVEAGPVKADRGQLTFHFYGAEDCPPCMAFKRKHLASVETAARERGFNVAVNVIERTADVPSVGSFGDTDPILREAAKELRIVYPPIFFVSRDGDVVSVHGADWQAALDAALSGAQS